MQQLGEFVVRHWALCGAFVIAMIAIIIEEIKSKGLMGSQLTPMMVTQKVNRENAVLIDLRDATAFREGHIQGAINMPAKDWSSHEKKINRYKSKPVILVDANGQQSNKMVSTLRQQGLEDVQVLGGGLTAWRTAKLPLTKGAQ